jgi:predicted acetyltransferase
MAIFVGHKADRRHIQALARCKQPENEALIELFEKVLEDTKMSLVVADDPARIHRLQGRAELLIDFIDSVEKSSGLLAKP